MIPAIMGIAKAGLGIVDQLVEDKDKKAELGMQWNMALLGAVEKLVSTTTVPWVDATVKLMAASVAMARPIGAFFLTLKGIDLAALDGAVDIVSGGLMSLFPAWMGARQYDKHAKKKKVIVQENDDTDLGW